MPSAIRPSLPSCVVVAAAASANWLAPAAFAQCDPVELGSVTTSGTAIELVAAGTTAYVADFSGGVQIVDFSDPAAPTIVGNAAFSGAEGVAIAGDLLHAVQTGFGLRIFDVSDPAAPIEIGVFQGSGQYFGVTVAGSLAYLARDSSGLQIVDVSDPTDPQLVGEVDTAGRAIDVVVDGGIAYVTDGANGVVVVDVSAPGAPTIVGGVNTPGFSEVAVLDADTLYVADSSGGLQIVDVSVPAAPVILGSVPSGQAAFGVAVAGDRAFVADGLGGVQVVDVSDPVNPIVLTTVDTGTGPRGAVLVGDTLALADAAGFRALDVGSCLDACSIDLDGDGTVGFFDITVLLSNWGPCARGAITSQTRTIEANAGSPCDGIFDSDSDAAPGLDLFDSEVEADASGPSSGGTGRASQTSTLTAQGIEATGYAYGEGGGCAGSGFGNGISLLSVGFTLTAPTPFQLVADADIFPGIGFVELSQGSTVLYSTLENFSAIDVTGILAPGTYRLDGRADHFSDPEFGGSDGSFEVTLTIDLTGDAACPADFDANGAVDIVDLITLLGAWGPCS